MEDLGSVTPHIITKKREPEVFGLGISLPPLLWLDVRVFYVRLSCCSLEDAPDILTIKYGPMAAACNFEINGSKVLSTEEPVLILRRDRVDTESSEATYVGTDRLRTTGPLAFEVRHKEESLICGAIDNSEAWLDGQGIDRIGAVGNATKRYKTGWMMECRCVISSSACVFLKRRADGKSASLSTPSIEVYIAGRYCGSPVVLTQTVELLVRRKLGRRKTLDSIPEVEEVERLNDDSASADLTNQMEDDSFYQELDCKQLGLLGGYMRDSYMDGDEGEITWFNAGVRVGVGIGLGMCIGLGIGVGLMMRAYQSTTRNLRRRFF
ncbi:hypothetical protein KP509_20G008200 [Ceratopteris richardii]|uniref:Erythronate-4-phosphate dehydrogenase family protein n=1 Tax=Ceratopteris richardii TaxID=49495 RepID=A0A8T2SEN4_CERRI|nr:hypothetical protein KP509_20G008200 [Ceratopteris richardii]KAH7330922.1 hypothetical protein KP509_20G008200 [Ceratopteris richardii]